MDHHHHPPLPPVALALTDFAALSVLGRGGKGVVFLIRTPGLSPPLLALKTISFNSVAAGGGGGAANHRIWSERDILLTLRHPLLPSLHAVLQTNHIIGLAIDRCPGGDLNSLRRRQTEHMFSDDIIRFYAAELVLALLHLHSLNIVYRDLKPDNVMIQASGHLMLVDFDLSTKLPTAAQPPQEAAAAAAAALPPPQPRKRRLFSCFSRDVGVSPESPSVSSVSSAAGRLNSFVGTEEYVAPEVIRGDGHDFSVDWWGLGIVLYEMLYGRTPFRGQNRKETFYRILCMEPKLVGERTALRDLIGRLLEKNPGKRISGREIKSHEFFRGVDWEAVVEVTRPPFIPVESELEEVEEEEVIEVEKFVQDVFQVKKDAKSLEGVNEQKQDKIGDFSVF